jgi:hypothetical protein
LLIANELHQNFGYFDNVCDIALAAARGQPAEPAPGSKRCAVLLKSRSQSAPIQRNMSSQKGAFFPMSDPLPAPAFTAPFNVRPTDAGSRYAAAIQ